MKCIYHVADFDGRCSAAIVKSKYPNCSLIPYDYGRKFPWEKIEKHEEIIMIDVSLPMDDMIKLDKISDFIWIDHHKTAIDEAKEKNFNPQGIREIGKAGCELSWEYFFHDLKMPEAVYMLGRYDVWDHKDKPDILAFQYGMKLFSTNPGSKIWKRLFSISKKDKDYDFISDIINDGYKILQFVKNENVSYAKGFAFEVELGEYKAIAINRGMANSQLFESVWDPKKYHFMIAFCMQKPENNHRWKVSLYTDRKDINVGKIAKKYKGGGHPGASGFECDELPFKYNNKEEDIVEVFLNDGEAKI